MQDRSDSKRHVGGVWRASLLRIIVPAVLTPALFITMVFLVVLPAFEHDLRTTRQETARYQVQAAVTLLESYGDQVTAGELSLDVAQARAMGRIRSMRYGEDGRDYFWISDLQPVILMHPYMSEIEGTDIFYIPDREGRPLLLAFLEIVDSPDQGGFCYYQWQDREKRTPPQDKISYVQLYEPWGWIVGSGVYLADVNERVAEMTRTMMAASMVILAAILAISFFLAYSGVRRERLRMEAEWALQDREATLSGVLDHTLQFIGLLAPSGELLLCNRTSLTFIGAELDDVVGRLFWDTPWWTRSSESQQVLKSLLARCLETGEVQRSEVLHHGKNGSVLEIAFSLSPVVAADGSITRLVAESLDITARNRATRALREREEDLATILDSIHDGVVALDPDGRVRRINAVARQWLSVEESQALGRPLGEVMSATGQDGQPLQDALGALLAAGAGRRPWAAECVGKDGTLSSVEILGAAVRTTGGEALGSLVVIRDRTAEEELRRQLFQSQKLEAVGRLAGGVAHDFNNLLTGILGNAQLLQDVFPRDDAVQRATNEIIEASTRAADLTGQLLAFSRKGKFQNVPVDLHDVATKVAALLERSIDKQIVLECDLAAAHPVVSGDASQLYNALLNLGLNARDAMPDGGTLRLATSDRQLTADHPRCQAAELAPGRYVELTVTDTGHGMNDEVRRHIFEPFYTTKSRGEGTGLGLAGVYGCVVNHLGGIDVASEVGRGTTFSILLPSIDEVPETKASETKVSARDESRSGGGLVMVVDDEEQIRSFALRALQKYGYQAVACADGLEAEAYLRAHHESVDLVILDLIMPNQGGEATFARLREISATVPVIIASGYSQDEVVESLMSQGASSFLAKPYTVRDLTHAVAEQLG